MPEIRVDLEKEHCAVLDGFCSATGKHRNEVVNEIVGAWASGKLHESILICRVAGVNPQAAEPGRHQGGM